MSDVAEPANIAKAYIDQHFPAMSDGTVSVDSHDPQHDMPLVNFLDDVQPEHIATDIYHVVTISKDITVDGGVVIPHSIKLKIKDNSVSSVLTSKSFNGS